MFAKVLAAACLRLMTLVGVVCATVDTTRGATSAAEKKLRAAIAMITPATGGNER